MGEPLSAQQVAELLKAHDGPLFAPMTQAELVHMVRIGDGEDRTPHIKGILRRLARELLSLRAALAQAEQDDGDPTNKQPCAYCGDLLGNRSRIMNCRDGDKIYHADPCWGLLQQERAEAAEARVAEVERERDENEEAWQTGVARLLLNAPPDCHSGMSLSKIGERIREAASLSPAEWDAIRALASAAEDACMASPYVSASSPAKEAIRKIALAYHSVLALLERTAAAQPTREGDA